MVAVRGSPCLASSCRMSHLGMNPVRGGSPPRDNKTKAVVVTIIGLFDQAIVRVLILVADESFSVRNAADVMKIYVPRARRVSWGAYCKTITIQPM